MLGHIEGKSQWLLGRENRQMFEFLWVTWLNRLGSPTRGHMSLVRGVGLTPETRLVNKGKLVVAFRIFSPHVPGSPIQVQRSFTRLPNSKRGPTIFTGQRFFVFLFFFLGGGGKKQIPYSSSCTEFSLNCFNIHFNSILELFLQPTELTGTHRQANRKDNQICRAYNLKPGYVTSHANPKHQN